LKGALVGILCWNIGFAVAAAAADAAVLLTGTHPVVALAVTFASCLMAERNLVTAAVVRFDAHPPLLLLLPNAPGISV
jgi:hypothetical protein